MATKTLKLINFSNSSLTDSESKNKLATLTDKNISTLTNSINWFLAKRRSGSANVKDMKDISGTTKKPYKQKGTGNARQGSKRSTQFVGGRTCHGPKSRSFSYSLPKKIIRSSINLAIRFKSSNDLLILSEKYDNKEIKTKNIAKFLSKNDIKSALIVTNDDSKILAKSISNIKNIKAANYDSLNSYDIIRYKYLIIEKDIYINKIEKNI